MSANIRPAARFLTGRPVTQLEIVLGRRADGSPGATLHAWGSGKWYTVPLADPHVVRALIEGLEDAFLHLADEEQR